MATETLAVNLLLQADQYKRQAREAATATGQITKGADQATTSTGRMSAGLSSVGTIAKVAVAGAAAAAVGSFVKGSVRAATDLEESINAVNVTFGDAAPAIHAIGEVSAESFGLAQSEFNAFAVQFSNFAQSIATGSGRQVNDVVGELTGRIADFASVMNLDVPEAAEKFQSGLAGQVEPLRAFGIDVSAAAVSQKALELGLAETTSELTEQDKVMARYELIMEQTDKTTGDFKNTQDGLANSTRVLNAQLEDFKARVGEEITPALADAASKGSLLLDILDPDVDLGWTQRLSAGLQLVLGDTTESIDAYIEQKTALNDTGDAADDLAERNVKLGERLASLNDITYQNIDATDGATDATEGLTTSVEALRFAEERQERATRASREALLAKRDALREIHDPLFRVVSLNEDLEDAEKAVEEASKKGVASPEYRDAVIDRANIIADLKETMVDLKNDGIDPTGAAARIMFEDLGVPPHVIDEIFAQFDALEKNFEGRLFQVSMSIPTFDVNQGGGVRRTGETVIRGQHGGIFEPRPGGTFVNLAEAGSREALIPLNGEGINILGAALREASGETVAGGSTFIFYGDVYGDEGFMRKVREANVQNARLGR